ncbi:hypothetical protein [Nostoc sp.]|uniref:hypothetical protein n=1 Tax=Nostoc sp. TaxID=1180 RepID=UPI002FF7D0B7
MNKTQYTFIPSSQSPVPSPLPLRVIQKSNRIAISGYIVKIDAIGCHKQIVKLITQQNAGYVII